MKVEMLRQYGTWRDVADAARTTIGKDAGEGEPTSVWKTRILKARHSPIREIIIRWKWIDLPYWVSVHFVRHHVGINHYVETQRTDRTGIKRDDLPQGALVTHQCSCNLDEFMTISQKRLCTNASIETRKAWSLVVEEIKDAHPELYRLCLPMCLTHGVCHEYNSCGMLQHVPF